MLTEDNAYGGVGLKSVYVLWEARRKRAIHTGLQLLRGMER